MNNYLFGKINEASDIAISLSINHLISLEKGGILFSILFLDAAMGGGGEIRKNTFFNNITSGIILFLYLYLRNNVRKKNLFYPEQNFFAQIRDNRCKKKINKR